MSETKENDRQRLDRAFSSLSPKERDALRAVAAAVDTDGAPLTDEQLAAVAAQRGAAGALDHFLGIIEGRYPDWSTPRVTPPRDLAETPYTARLKPLDSLCYGAPMYRTVCGFQAPDGRQCPAQIGRTESIGPGAADSSARAILHALEMILPPEARPRGSSLWLITAPPDFPGFVPNEHGYYEVIRPRRERDRTGEYRRRTRGRRNMHHYLAEKAMLTGALSSEEARRDILGWVAELPAVVKCHQCGRLIRVEPPKYPLSQLP